MGSKAAESPKQSTTVALMWATLVRSILVPVTVVVIVLQVWELGEIVYVQLSHVTCIGGWIPQGLVMLITPAANEAVGTHSSLVGLTINVAVRLVLPWPFVVLVNVIVVLYVP
jgi:hypothetical protein